MWQGEAPLTWVLRLAVVAAVAVSTASTAEERLPEVVVTAPPIRATTPSTRDPTAFAAIVETREAPTSVETLTDVLSNTVGVQVRRFGGLGDFSTVSVRGFSPGQVQVYLDGVPLSRADNEVVNLSDLPLDAVDHVEVYRGTTPLIFSQSGPGGVVNVVTRRPGATPLAAASASYGSFQTRKASLAGAGSSGAWEGFAFGQYLGSEGDFPFTNSGETENPADDVRLHRINNEFDQGALTARLVYRDQPVTLALTTDSFVKSQGVPGPETLQSETAHRDTLRQIAHLDLAVTPTPGFPVGIDAGLFGVVQRQSFTSDDLRGPFLPTDVDDDSTTVGGQLVARGALGRHQVPGLLVASSVESFVDTNGIRNDRLRVGTSPTRTRTRLTLAGEDEILLLSDRLSIVPNLRWELYRDVFPGDPRIRTPSEQTGGRRTQDFFTPRLGVRADVGWGVTLLGNGGRTARVPNLTELFGNNGIIRGDPDLKPEVAVSWDLGFRAQSPWTSDVLTTAGLEFAYFSSDLTDVIVLVPSSISTFRPENIGAATIRGEEVSFRAAFWDRLLLTTNYTHQDTRDESDDAFARGNQLPGRPADEFYGRLELTWSRERPLPIGSLGARLWPGRIYYDVDLIADNVLTRSRINPETVPSRAYHGVGLSLTVPWAGVQLTYEVKNLTDDQTADALRFPLPGRSMFVTASYGFGAPAPAVAAP
jgi:iron complex outermembrane receptor protein